MTPHDESPSVQQQAVLDEIDDLFRQRGHSWYAGEAVTQLQHALQAALLAEQHDAPASLIAAALLHDYGHLLHNFGEDCAEQGVDDRHEDLGAKRLQQFFGPEVTEPIRFHVPAKRYLCATEPEYFSGLSDASVLSLNLQGGPFAPEEAAEFIAQPYAQEGVRLRRWDDQAKVVDQQTPDIAHFRQYLIAAML